MSKAKPMWRADIESETVERYWPDNAKEMAKINESLVNGEVVQGRETFTWHHSKKGAYEWLVTESEDRITAAIAVRNRIIKQREVDRIIEGNKNG